MVLAHAEVPFLGLDHLAGKPSRNWQFGASQGRIWGLGYAGSHLPGQKYGGQSGHEVTAASLAVGSRDCSAVGGLFLCSQACSQGAARGMVTEGCVGVGVSNPGACVVVLRVNAGGQELSKKWFSLMHSYSGHTC